MFFLKVSNPTLDTVLFRFTPSNDTGEPVLFVDGDNDDSMKTTTYFPDLVVDTVRSFQSVMKVNARLQTTVLNIVATTETVELLSAEDIIIELGATKAGATPIEVLDWDKKITDTVSFNQNFFMIQIQQPVPNPTNVLDAKYN